MSSNRKMTAEILAQQPGVLAVFVGLMHQHGDWKAWIAHAGRLMNSAAETNAKSIVMHIDRHHTLHLLQECGSMCVVVMETGCKFAKCVARSMRRALENATAPPKPQTKRATETQTSDDRPATSSSKGASW